MIVVGYVVHKVICGFSLPQGVRQGGPLWVSLDHGSLYLAAIGDIYCGVSTLNVIHRCRRVGPPPGNFLWGRECP